MTVIGEDACEKFEGFKFEQGEAENNKGNDSLQLETQTRDDRFAQLKNVLSHQKETAKQILDLKDKGEAVKKNIGWHADSNDFAVQKRSKEVAENETKQETKGYTKECKQANFKIHDSSRQSINAF